MVAASFVPSDYWCNYSQIE